MDRYVLSCSQEECSVFQLPVKQVPGGLTVSKKTKKNPLSKKTTWFEYLFYLFLFLNFCFCFVFVLFFWLWKIRCTKAESIYINSKTNEGYPRGIYFQMLHFPSHKQIRSCLRGILSKTKQKQNQNQKQKPTFAFNIFIDIS